MHKNNTSDHPHEWMSTDTSPDSLRDGIDEHPKHGVHLAICVIILCVLAVIVFTLSLPFSLLNGTSIKNAINQNAIWKQSENNDVSSASGNQNAEQNVSSDSNGNNMMNNQNAASNSSESPADSSDGLLADGKGTDEIVDNVAAADASVLKGGMQVSGNGWSMVLPASWNGNVVISYDASGNSAYVYPSGSGVPAGNPDGYQRPYCLLIEKADGAEPNAAGDIGSQLAYSVPSSDKSWHLEVWTLNAVWLTRQATEDRIPYQGVSNETWGSMLTMLTGGTVNSVTESQALSDSDSFIGTGIADYIASICKAQQITS